MFGQDEKTVDQIYKEKSKKTSLDIIDPAADKHYEQNGVMNTSGFEHAVAK